MSLLGTRLEAHPATAAASTVLSVPHGIGSFCREANITVESCNRGIRSVYADVKTTCVSLLGTRLEAQRATAAASAVLSVPNVIGSFCRESNITAESCNRDIRSVYADVKAACASLAASSWKLAEPSLRTCRSTTFRSSLTCARNRRRRSISDKLEGRAFYSRAIAFDCRAKRVCKLFV